MHPFATDLASGRLAPLTFDWLANPAGHAPVQGLAYSAQVPAAAPVAHAA